MTSIAWVTKKTRGNPQTLAIGMVKKGAPEGTVTIGGPPSQGALSFSVILRPGRALEVGLLAVIASFCASEGIRKDTGIITWIRWPDEVVAGTDVVASTSMVTGRSMGLPWVILNFRVNRRPLRRPGSTSLDGLLGVPVDPGMLVAKILRSLSWMLSGWVKGMYPQILPRIGSMLENAGGRVRVAQDGKAVPGMVIGVDERGRLIVALEGSDSSTRVERRSSLLNV